MGKIDYKKLYATQDESLRAIFSVPTNFYLTGGTCLHRFYNEKRYSDDLDLFNNENNLFREDVRLLIATFYDSGITFERIVDERDFVRVIVQNTLQIDFVNDRVKRYGTSIRRDDYLVLDNLENIAANKICAVLGRDEPKDIFDLFVLYKEHSLDWSLILEESNLKCIVDPEILEYRLSIFPLGMLDIIAVYEKKYISVIRHEYPEMMQVVLNGITS